MKTKIHLIATFLLLGIYANIYSQNVFPTSDAIWNIKIDGKENYYGLSGDTIIDSKLYNKLYLLNDTTLNIDSGDMYIGGFREEGEKVWFKPNLSSNYFINPLYTQYQEETLLYDFSKSVGDTIWHNIFYNNADIGGWEIGDSITASIITSIDTDEQGRKIYYTQQYLFHSYYKELIYLGYGRNDNWIEGIGSVQHGLFWFLCDLPLTGFPTFHLICFKQGNEIKYMDANCSSCFSWTTGILDTNNIPLEIVYENNNIRIKADPTVFPCELKLFSITGQLIFEKQLQSSTEVMLVNQLKGAWLYQVQKNREILKKGKIMIK